MRYNIPQFIDTEDKVIGPLTIKQFLWLLGGGGIIFLIWTFAGSMFIFFVFSAPIAGIAVIMAFKKMNGKSMIDVVINFFKLSTSPKKYIWKKENKNNEWDKQ